jgi:hypothetical protein
MDHLTRSDSTSAGPIGHVGAEPLWEVPRGRPCLHMRWRQAAGLHDSLLAQNHRSLMDASAIPYDDSNQLSGDGAPSKTTHAKVTAHQHWAQQELTPALSSAKSQCGEPPTAPIPKTRDQPEKRNSKRSRPCGNNASTWYRACHPPASTCKGERATGTSQLDAGTTTGSAHTKNPERPASGRSAPGR